MSDNLLSDGLRIANGWARRLPKRLGTDTASEFQETSFGHPNGTPATCLGTLSREIWKPDRLKSNLHKSLKEMTYRTGVPMKWREMEC